MMPKKLFYYFSIAIGISACSSQDDFMTKNDYSETGGKEPYELVFMVPDTTRTIQSQEKALDIANRFLTVTGVQTRSSEESDVIIINDNIGNPLIYIINYSDNNGFVVLSAKKDTQPVLAYGESGAFKLDGLEGSPVEMWLQDIKQYVEYSTLLPDSIKLGNSIQWNSLTYELSEPRLMKTRSWGDQEEMNVVEQALQIYRSQGYQIIEKPRADVHTYTAELNQALNNLSDTKGWDGYSQRDKSFLLVKTKSSTEKKNAMTSTEWGQGDPYNGKLTEYTTKTKSLGCVTIAVAQIMKYYGKTNGGFKYDKMPDILSSSSSEEEKEVLSSFLFFIGKDCLGIKYEEGDSGSNINNAVGVLKKHGFSSAKIVSYDFATIKNEIKNYGPVYLRAQNPVDTIGHAWVCDGYSNTTSSTEYKLITYNGNYQDASPTACFNTIYTGGGAIAGTTKGLHMNWGWKGLYNNFYYYDNWTPGSDNYSTDRYAIIGLK